MRVKGATPQWKMVYEKVRDLEPGRVITWEELYDTLNTRDKTKVATVVRRAIRELWEKDHRSMTSVFGEGYRMMHAKEHEAQAMRYKEQSNRRMRDGLQVLKATRLDDLDEIGRKRTMAATMVIEGLVQRMEGLSERQEQTENILASVVQRVERLEQPSLPAAYSEQPALPTQSDLAAQVTGASPPG